jgi:hypothetical protein
VLPAETQRPASPGSGARSRRRRKRRPRLVLGTLRHLPSNRRWSQCPLHPVVGGFHQRFFQKAQQLPLEVVPLCIFGLQRLISGGQLGDLALQFANLMLQLDYQGQQLLQVQRGSIFRPRRCLKYELPQIGKEVSFDMRAPSASALSGFHPLGPFVCLLRPGLVPRWRTPTRFTLSLMIMMLGGL